MRFAFERAHIFSKGSGNCSCPVNIIRVTFLEHDILDGRVRHFGVESVKQTHKVYLEEEPRAYRHRLAWSMEFNHQREIRAAIKRFRPTIMIGVPSVYSALLGAKINWIQKLLNPIRIYISGAAPLPVEVLKKFEKVLEVNRLNSYSRKDSIFEV